MSTTRSPQARLREWIAPVLVLLVGVGLSAFYLGDAHIWDDDFAGYLLQARALMNGSVAQEVILNHDLFAASDVRIGPDAYPWGLPLLIALVASSVGWGVTGLKMIGLFSYLIYGGLTYRLARVLQIGLLGATTCAALTLWQPEIVGEVGYIGSDLPFAALSLPCLLLLTRVLTDVKPTSATNTSRGQFKLIFGATLFAILAFTVRWNGAVLFGTVVCAMVLHRQANPLWSHKQRVIVWLGFTSVTVVALFVYFRLLPDGSRVHLNYLSADPQLLLHRLHDHTANLSALIPIIVLPRALRSLGVLVFAIISGVGVVALRQQGLLLLAYLGGHFLLLTFFTGNGGIRYYFPVIPVLAILTTAGLGLLFAKMSLTHSHRMFCEQVFASFMVISLLALVVVLPFVVSYQSYTNTTNGPFSPATLEMLQALKQHVPSNKRVAYYRPRAFRWLSGYETLLVNRPDSARQVEAIVLNLAGKPQYQLSSAQIEAIGEFVLAFRSQLFLIYVRRSHEQPSPISVNHTAP